jgi:hypothetical protein
MSTRVPRRLPFVGFVTQPTNQSLLSFEAQITKPQLSVLRPKSENRRPWFWGQTKKTITTDFDIKPEKTVPLILMSNQEKPYEWFWGQTTHKPSQWFWGQTTDKPTQWFWCQTTDKSSTLVLRLNQKIHTFSLHVHSADRTQRHPTSRSPGH